MLIRGGVPREDCENARLCVSVAIVGIMFLT